VNAAVSAALEDFTLRCLERDPAARWASVAEMLPAFESARQTQRGFLDLRAVPPHPTAEDWSSRAVHHLASGGYREAERLAAHEFSRSEDPHAFSLMAAAAIRDGRHYDCLRMIDDHPELLSGGGPAAADLRLLALKACLETQQLHRAERLVEECQQDRPGDAGVLLKKASVLGAQARYQEAADILLGLNREHPGRPSILKRLVLAFEQLRDVGKAAAFLRAFLRERPDDEWGRAKLEQYAALGVA
jgi:serine/threonine-protein kinase